MLFNMFINTIKEKNNINEELYNVDFLPSIFKLYSLLDLYESKCDPTKKLFPIPDYISFKRTSVNIILRCGFNNVDKIHFNNTIIDSFIDGIEITENDSYDVFIELKNRIEIDSIVLNTIPEME